MANDKQAEAEAVEMGPADRRRAFMAQRREELIEANELPAHEADAPAGYGEPVEQASSDSEMKIPAGGKGKSNNGKKNAPVE